MTNLFEDLREQFIGNLLTKTSEQIATTYKKKMNQSKIYFKEQFSFIEKNQVNSEKYTFINEDEFENLLNDIEFVFDETTYGNKTNEELDIFKVVVEPTKLLDILDTTIQTASEINQKINDNHDIIFEHDKKLLNKKNTLLLSKDPENFVEIINIIKEREKISYILLDLDVEITNSLIELFNLKFLKLQKDDLLITLESIKTQVKIVKDIIPLFREYENKYLVR
tara:strand:+ start:282 stop:953 length:672 start_codon:yes stop_codon:yes gene_type:complete